MKEIELDRPVHFVSSTSSEVHVDKAKLLCVCSAQKNTTTDSNRAGDRRMVFELDLKTVSGAKTRRVQSSHCTYVTEFKACSRQFCIERSGRYVVACQGDTMQIWDALNEEMFQYEHSYRLTAAEFHPTDFCLATGDQNGVVTLWYRLCRSDGHHPAKVSLHWHAHAVADICFSSDGSYLYSGGEEAVLVVWQVETRRTRFLPRLGAAIQFVSCSANSLFIALSHKDNIIQLVSGHQLEVERMVGGLIKTTGIEGSHYHSCIPAGLTVDPRYHCLVTNSRPGQIQFYSPWTDQHILSIDVTGQNYVSRREDKPFVYVQVTNVSFSSCKTWMATVEHRDDGVATMELTLKFWWFNNEKQMYDVNTSVELPHEKQITGLQFQPRHDDALPAMCVSASFDGKVKFWSQIVEESAEGTSLQWWTCQAVTYYHDLPALGVSFSEDGSLVAVTFGRAVTVWNCSACVLQTTLSCPFNEEQVMNVQFGQDSASHCLVASSQGHLMVWNMLTCTLMWCVSLSIHTLVASSCSSIFGAFTSSNSSQMLVIFDPRNPRPVAVYDQIGDHEVEAAVFIPQAPYIVRQLAESVTGSDLWRLKSELVWMDNEQIIRSLPWPETVETEHPDGLDATVPSEDMTAVLPRIFHTQRQMSSVNNAQSSVRLDAASLNAAMRTKLLSGPAHTLPTVSSISSKFLQSFLAQNPQPDNEGSNAGIGMETDVGGDEDGTEPKTSDSASDTDEDDTKVDLAEAPGSDDAGDVPLPSLAPVMTSLTSSQVGSFSWLQGILASGDVA